MISVVIAGALLLGAAQQQMDTTFAVRAGGELRLDGMNGSATITTWDRSQMRVRATNVRAAELEIDVDESDVSIDVDHRGAPRSITLEITLPRNYHVHVDGMNMGVAVTGLTGNVSVDNVEGAVTVRGTTGDVLVESVSGGITVENVRGDVDVTTVNQAIRISGTRGRIEAETVNGSIVMRNVDAAEVAAGTVNGLVEYIGTVRDGGSYFLGTHNGRITMGIPVGANAQVAVTTHTGRVETAFPVRMGGTSEREFSFTLGSGSARIELESFNGTVNLVRPDGR